MAVANLIIEENEQPTQNRARTGMEANTSKSDERIGPGSDPVSRGRHLNVDEVLAGSLRKVGSE